MNTVENLYGHFSIFYKISLLFEKIYNLISLQVIDQTVYSSHDERDLYPANRILKQ
jgi:hypothetical protein